MINVKDFGVKGDGKTDDSMPLQDILDSVQKTGGFVYFPEGVYLIKSTLRVPDLKNDFFIKGDLATIKRGDDCVKKDFQPIISLQSSNNIRLSIEGIRFDGNATNNQLPSGSNPTIWQHTHCLTILSVGYGFNQISLKNIEVIDCTADGIGIGGGDGDFIGDIYAENIREYKRNRTRSGLTITCGYSSLIVSNCSLEKLEVETNSPNQVGNTVVSNSQIRKAFDFNYKNSTYAPSLLVTNLFVSGRFNVCNYNLIASNCCFSLDVQNRLTSGDVRCDVEYINCTFRDQKSFSDPSLICVNNQKTSPRLVKFKDCLFETNYCNSVFYDNNSVYFDRVTVFKDCFFYGVAESVFNIRSGTFKIIENHIYTKTQKEVVKHTSPTLPNIPNYIELSNNRTLCPLYVKPSVGNVQVRAGSNFFFDGKKADPIV